MTEPDGSETGTGGLTDTGGETGTGGVADRDRRYLDAAATAPLRPAAYDAMLSVLAAGQANPSSVHSPGHRARGIVTDARATLAEAFGCRASEIVCTAGGTEANNLAVIGLSLAHPRGRHIITSAVEHPSITESCAYLARVFRFEITVLPVDRHGRISLEELERALRPDTSLLTVSLANGEIGTVQPLPELAAAAREMGVLVHADAVQAAASLPVSYGAGGWPGTAVDAMTVASHKFGGPHGAGALLLRDGLAIEPLVHGGGQEGGRRSGTENVVAIAGFAAAVRDAMQSVGSRALAIIQSRDELISRVLAEVPGASLTGDPGERLPGHASFVIDGQSGESVLVALDAAGFAVSSGSACAAGKDEPSPTLLAIGLDESLARTAVRFTLAHELRGPDIDRIVEVIVREVNGRRSPGATGLTRAAGSGAGTRAAGAGRVMAAAGAPNSRPS